MIAAAGLVAALAAGTPLAASAAAGQAGAVPAAASRPGPAADPGFPTFVHLPADQAAHPHVANEWWYTVGHLYSQGHEYGYEVTLFPFGLAEIAITDVTGHKFYTHTFLYKAGQYSVSSKQLDVRMPAATLSGPMNDMHLTATLPQGHLDLRLNAKGPTNYMNGTGLIPFLKGSSYYYSLPDLQTSGTLTLNGKTSTVTGLSWLDRQWGNWDLTICASGPGWPSSLRTARSSTSLICSRCRASSTGPPCCTATGRRVSYPSSRWPSTRPTSRPAPGPGIGTPASGPSRSPA